MKNILKNNYNHIPKHVLNYDSIYIVKFLYTV